MLDYINWYLVELKLRITPRIPEDRLETILKESRSHLVQSSERIALEKGIDTRHAALLAIEDFGSPEKVAQTYLRESHPRLFGTKPIVTVIISAVIATFCFCYPFVTLHGYFDVFGESWQYLFVGVLGIFSLVLFALGCRAGYRSNTFTLLATSGTMVLGSILLLSFWIVGSNGYQGFNRFHLGRDVSTAHSTLNKLENLARYYQAGKTAFANAKTASDIPSEFTSPTLADKVIGLSDAWLEERSHGNSPSPEKLSYIIPGSSVSGYVDGRVWGPEVEVLTLKEAQNSWKENADRALQSIPRAENDLNVLLASAQEARSGRLFFLNRDVYSETDASIITFTPALLIFDWVLYVTGRRRKARLNQITA